MKITKFILEADKIIIESENDTDDPAVKHSGLLAEKALDVVTTNNRELNTDSSSSNVFRSVGYFGVGFGGSKGTHGQISQKYRLDQIDLTKFTHINASFLAIEADGHLSFPNSFSSQGTGSANATPAWLQDVNTQYIESYIRRFRAIDIELERTIVRRLSDACTTPVRRRHDGARLVWLSQPAS